MKFELEEMRRKRYETGKKPPSGKPGSPLRPPTKKKGDLFGHIGWFRKKPDKLDRIEDIRINYCPECGSKDLTECKIGISLKGPELLSIVG